MVRRAACCRFRNERCGRARRGSPPGKNIDNTNSGSKQQTIYLYRRGSPPGKQINRNNS